MDYKRIFSPLCHLPTKATGFGQPNPSIEFRQTALKKSEVWILSAGIQAENPTLIQGSQFPRNESPSEQESSPLGDPEILIDPIRFILTIRTGFHQD